MEDFLRRIKIIDNTTTTLQTNKTEFVNRLNEITDKGSTSVMSDFFDLFSSSKKEYKGQVKPNSFKIKRRKRMFETNLNLAVASGTFKEENGQLTVETEINAFSNYFIFFYIFLILIYSIFIITFLIGDIKVDFFAIPFFLIHGILMFTIPLFVMIRSVKRLKYELEREFFYLTKQSNI